MSGRNKSLLVTYRCGKRSNHGDYHCKNKDVNRDYLESFIFKRIGELVFNENRIPDLIEAYYQSCGDMFGETAHRLKELRSNLEITDQKLANVVNVIATTGSPTLEKLEQDREIILMQIKCEEESLVSNKLDEDEIISAYRHAQKLYENGILPQRKQLLNLYLKKVLVYPEYIEIQLNNVPTNILKPSQASDGPAIGGLHTFRFTKPKLEKNKETQRNEKTFISLSPTGGGEGNFPPSTSLPELLHGSGYCGGGGSFFPPSTGEQNEHLLRLIDLITAKADRNEINIRINHMLFLHIFHI